MPSQNFSVAAEGRNELLCYFAASQDHYVGFSRLLSTMFPSFVQFSLTSVVTVSLPHWGQGSGVQPRNYWKLQFLGKKISLMANSLEEDSCFNYRKFLNILK